MRSELIFGAMTYVSNRFLLTRLASKATRSFHRPNTRIEDTANEVFERFTRVNPLAGASYAGNLQSFPRAAQEETHSTYDDLEQSVAWTQEVKMPQPIHFVEERATPYPTVADFLRAFDEEMHSLYLLSFLLTADHDKAEQCLVSAMGECVEGIGVFMDGRVHGLGRRF
jgi:hypothetical protein